MYTTQRLSLLLIPVLLLSIPFLIFPLFGLRSAEDLEIHLVGEQENHLRQFASALSEQISGQIEGALQNKTVQQRQEQKPTFSRLSGTMRLDGFNNDWPAELAVSRLQNGIDPDNLSYRFYSGIQGQYLYLLFEVRDDIVTYRATDTLKLDESDHLQIIVFSGEEQRKYIAAGYKPGWIVGFEIPGDPLQIAKIEKRIHGIWRTSDNGYNLEARIDRALLGEDFSLAIADVDGSDIRSIAALLDTSGSPEPVVREPTWSEVIDLNEILGAGNFVPADYRVRVIDENLQILAETGTLAGVSGSPPPADATKKIPDLNGIRDALAGQQTVVHYHSPPIPDEITAAIAPVRNDDDVVAVVTVEQNINPILSPLKESINETILLFVTTFILGSGGICLYLLRLTRPGKTKSA